MYLHDIVSACQRAAFAAQRQKPKTTSRVKQLMMPKKLRALERAMAVASDIIKHGGPFDTVSSNFTPALLATLRTAISASKRTPAISGGTFPFTLPLMICSIAARTPIAVK